MKCEFGIVEYGKLLAVRVSQYINVFMFKGTPVLQTVY